ncbi:OTU domain-containing protein [Mycena sanguinolenta]|uniref:OTU domain-containing protein n=1 Tax=Mycena sanguinolenta TaxID=230812 RepID=A0A8H7D992_9AGAR|nr:OTU domain-containing protein [Mycena sanguinolenta]
MAKKSKLKKALDILPSPPPPQDDDDGLMDDLLAQLDSRDQVVAQESANVLNDMQIQKQAENLDAAPKQDAKSRFKAPALAQTYAADDPAAEARLEKEAKDEERDIKRVCDELNVQIHEINPDGHCLFSAVADQLRLLSVLPPEQATYQTTRGAAASYIYSHQDDFLPFLPSAAGEDGSGAHDPGFMSPQEFRQYCESVRETAVWGGEPEILALSRMYNVPIHVVQAGRPPVVIHNPSGSSTDDQVMDTRVARISYHRRMYGLGEVSHSVLLSVLWAPTVSPQHYNSLRPKSKRSQITNALQNIVPIP